MRTTKSFLRVINKMHRPHWLMIFLLAAMNGCAAGDDMPSKDDAPKNTPSSVPTTLLADAKADAARRTGKSEKEITVVSAESVTWPDASMGCPAPGMMYAQVLMPGYRIVLRVGDKQFDYHAGKSGKPALCPPDRARPPTQSRDN
jgi:hypothetical protein